MYRSYLKRIFDFIVALGAFFFFLPLLLCLAVWLIFKDKQHPLFVQNRLGLDGKSFRIIKLRTMNNKRDRNGELLPSKERITKLGRLLRKTSMDELPQLLNVIEGDMSLVGPRPLLEEYLPLYSDLQKRRHEVRPGITGWAQINGRNSISWQQKFELDVWYVDHLGFGLDLKIMWRTVKRLFSSKKKGDNGDQIMPVFTGND